MTTPLLSLRGLEREAQRHLPPRIHDFYAGGADDEVTLRANEAAFARIGLRPRVLRGCGEPDLGVSLLGCRLSMPVLAAPTAFHKLAHPEGERAVARACAQAGTTMIVAMASTVAIGQVAAAARVAAPDAPRPWFQVYIQPDLAFTADIVERAQAAGCAALVVSVDSPAFGRRERDVRNGFLDLPAGLQCENLRETDAGPEPGRVRPIEFWPGLSWSHLAWLRGITPLPIVLKGIAHPADAQLAIEHGASALIVSNHGGRQLDTVSAGIDLLPDIVEAVGGRIPVLLDGGVRRGSDIVKALALGASAVAVGRPVLWALAASGEQGVTDALELLRAELGRALTLCGCASAVDVPRDLIHTRESAC